MKFNSRLSVLCCLIALCFIMSNISVAEPSNPVKTPVMNDAANMLYHGIYDNKEITLKDGKWSGKPFVQGTASRPTAGLIKNFTFSGDIDDNGTQERVVFLWESSGGSGTRIYMALLGFYNDKFVNLDTHFIGDRVELIMGNINQGKIELDVVQSAKGDAACCPTHKILRTWSLKDSYNSMQLIENKPQSLGRISLTDLEGVEWTLTQMKRHENLAVKTKITMTFKDNRISGRSGCNRYFAAVKAGKMPKDVTISQAGGTRMACPANIMELELRFLNALSNVKKYSFINGQLALTWKDDDVINTMLFSTQKMKF